MDSAHPCTLACENALARSSSGDISNACSWILVGDAARLGMSFSNTFVTFGDQKHSLPLLLTLEQKQ